MNYTEIFEALNNTLKEQKTTIKVQKYQIESLERKIAELESGKVCMTRIGE